MEVVLFKLLALAVMEFLYAFWTRLTGSGAKEQSDTEDQQE